MSQLTHPSAPLGAYVRAHRLLALAALLALVATTAVVLLLAIGDNPSTSSTADQPRAAERADGGPESAPLPQQEHPLRSRLGTTQSGAPITSSRYDGGPEEGTRGMPSSNAPSTTAAGVRFDGGPEEGSRGLGR